MTDDKKIIEISAEAWQRLKIEAAITGDTQYEIASHAILTQLGNASLTDQPPRRRHDD